MAVYTNTVSRKPELKKSTTNLHDIFVILTDDFQNYGAGFPIRCKLFQSKEVTNQIQGADIGVLDKRIYADDTTENIKTETKMRRATDKNSTKTTEQRTNNHCIWRKVIKSNEQELEQS